MRVPDEPGPREDGMGALLLSGRSAFANARRASWHLRHGGLSGYRRWARRRSAAGDDVSAAAAWTDADGRLTFEPWPVPERRVRRPGLRVAVVLDDFSRTAFRFEWEQVPVQPSSWRRTLAEQPVDLLFVESAWAGNGGGWAYHLTGPSAPRPAIRELVAWCREQGVPTVFWNKEDPAHFDDFIETAGLFDHVLTTDADRLPDYERALGHDRTGVLGFAAQPAIHNPVRSGSGRQERDVAFAGMYFSHRHPERRRQMHMLLDAALQVSPRMTTGLEIFSRQLGGDERYQFPEPYDTRVVGSLDYSRMLSAYRAYKVFLNVNTVVDSPTMCARRIFEITACGTPVVSTPSAAISAHFDESQVPQVERVEDAQHMIRALVRSPELRDRMVHLAQRSIWSRHTFSHRVHQVLQAAGLPDPAPPTTPSVSVLVSTNRPHQLEHLMQAVGSQVGVEVELVLVAHGFEVDPRAVTTMAHRCGVGDVVLRSLPAGVPLGQCLNEAVQLASGTLVAKLDDDDVYGPHYLSDQVHAMGYSGADLVGKQAHYLYMQSTDAMLLRFAEREHRWTDFVMGPTIVTSRALAAELRFPPLPRGEDTGFLRRVVDSGARVYSADRFNFVQVRNAASTHTWNATDPELLASGRVHGFGRNYAHAIF